MKMQQWIEWIEELIEMWRRDEEILAARGEEKAAMYFKVLADDVEAQIQNWKDDEIWKE